MAVDTPKMGPGMGVEANPGPSLLEAPLAGEKGGGVLPPDLEELWRHLYTSMLPREEISRPRLLAISSALDGEGKTTVALGMAATAARDLEKSIVLVDCNLLRPGLSESLGLAAVPGLSSFLSGDASLDAVLHSIGLPKLLVIPAGPPAASPSRLLRSSAMAKLLLQLRDPEHEVVILDTPSLLKSSDARVLLSGCDGLLLVVRAGVSSPRMVEEALAMSGGVDSRAMVINGFRRPMPEPLHRLLARLR